MTHSKNDLLKELERRDEIQTKLNQLNWEKGEIDKIITAEVMNKVVDGDLTNNVLTINWRTLRKELRR